MQAKYPCDLHGHTNRSDGNDSPLEFITKAAERGMKVVAITDHDMAPVQTVCDNGRNINLAAFAAKKGIQLLNGIEISCETEIEDVHLVCFGCDWDNLFFHQLEELTIESKKESYHKLVELLALNGIMVSWEELLVNQGKQIKESLVQKKMIFELMAEKGYAASWKDAKIMIKQHSEFSVQRKKPNAADVISEIHKTGGIVILAHPYLVADEVRYQNQLMDRHTFIERLISAGLDGIEASYPYDKTSYGGVMNPQEIYQEVVSRYGNRGLIISGGSDYHADEKKGTINPREIGECGISLEEFKSYNKLVY